MIIENFADKLYETVISRMRHVSLNCLFLSASDMQHRAVTRHAVAHSAEEALQAALSSLEEVLKKNNIRPHILRADWVSHHTKIPWSEAEKRITSTRRNYFRHGISLDEDWKLVFTEQELNANAMLYSGGDNPNGCFNAKNSAHYCKFRYGCSLPELNDHNTVILFTTQGCFCELDGQVHYISGSGPGAGRRDITTVDSDTVRSVVLSGADWLARQCGPDGRFNYGFFPCFDRPIPTYNTLRHISSTWSLLDVYKLTGDKNLRSAAERAISYLLKTFLRRHTLPDGQEAVFFEDRESREIKLGSSGVALLLLSTYTELIHPKRYIPLMNAVARGILYLQKADGSFTHVLDSTDFSVKQAFRIVYYDGEAVFGLLRLYAITRAPALLNAVERAFSRFIEKNYWKHHDHWLSYSVNEITRWKPEAKYFEFGIKNFLEYLPFVRKRETAFPTLLELMMAAEAMLRRMEEMSDMNKLLARVDKKVFYDALTYRAHYLLNSFFWPETAMFFKKPERISGSFYIRHHAFRTRIDDVEHFLSGLTAYMRYLERPDAQVCLLYRLAGQLKNWQK